MVDWSNPEVKISAHFLVHESLFLSQWNCMHVPSEEEKQNILFMAQKMDMVQEFLQVPINVHCWIRPLLNQPNSIYSGLDYNAMVRGAKNSAHKIGLAVDFDVEPDMTCDVARAKLEHKLEEFNLRMEQNPGSRWVHLDARIPGPGGRFFKP